MLGLAVYGCISTNEAYQLTIPASIGGTVCINHVLSQQANDFPIHPFAHAIIDPDTSEAMEYHDLISNHRT